MSVVPLDSPASADAPGPRGPAACPPSNIATAARRFGDEYPLKRRQWPFRAIGAAVLALMLFYLTWMFPHLNGALPWLAWPFAVASCLSAVCLTLSIVNGWTQRITPPRLLAGEDVPHVAVLIPTCGEPVPMIVRTVLGVLEQDYPADRRLIVVSDDGHDPVLRAALAELDVVYHEPPDRWSPGRDGAAKAGNLNSALALVLASHPEADYIETRDADDEVGTVRFLRHTVGQLVADPRLAFVQTVKEAQVSAGDPFCNFDAQFYRSQMLSRDSQNAVFPCGSGLVWRREALEDIGGFPVWNLVEDFQSGVEALRRGWRGCYLPIVGAVGQHSPEDVPNVIKQRGTWAIDTVRLMLWGKLGGLSLRQRLAFTETLFFYLHSFTVLVYVPATALACLSLVPVRASALSCLIHLMPYALATEARLMLLNHPFGDRRRHQRHPIRALWRVKVMWMGLAPVYVVGCLKAIFGGPRRKPTYKVTRKTTEARWYWRETLPNALLSTVVPVGFLIGLVAHRLPHPVILISAGYWGLIAGGALFGFFQLGWYGRSPLHSRRSPSAVEQRRDEPAPDVASATPPEPAAAIAA